ncbi:MAG TPA: MYXO-CTERM sorting domain-containing protein, partial [Polyangiaceae bacterium]
IQPSGGRSPGGGNAPTAGGQGVSRGSPEDEGCGCRTVSASSNGAFAGLALAGLVALFRRRRVRARPN